MEPTLLVLLTTTAAASAAGVGALFLGRGRKLSLAGVGWASAVAAGVMLGAAYALSTASIDLLLFGGGAILGILFVQLLHRLEGELSFHVEDQLSQDPTYSYRVFLAFSLHSALEGIGIGAAMAFHLPFGIFMVAIIALHNIAEGTVIIAILRAQEVSLATAGGIAMVTRLGQALVAVVVFAITRENPHLLSSAAGLGAGTLIHLVFVELLPESYREAGRTSIALVAAFAMAVVIFFRSFAG